LDSVDGAFAYGLGQDLDKPGLEHRRRTRLQLTDGNGTRHELYLKRYEDEGFWRKLGRRRTYGRRKSPAVCEFDNIRAVRAAGVPTMQSVICGQRGGVLRRCRSYVIVTAVPGRSLEKCASALLAAEPTAGLALAVKLGHLAGALHGHGLVHRDFYACHIFVNHNGKTSATETQRAQRKEERRNSGAVSTQNAFGGEFDLYLIDLARVFAPRWRQFRWRVKDLAQLKYSMPTHWVNEHWDHLLDSYLDAFEEHCGKQRGSGTGVTARGWDASDTNRLGHAIDCKAAAMVGRAARRRGAGERPA
jgi:hypothetical protein